MLRGGARHGGQVRDYHCLFLARLIGHLQFNPTSVKFIFLFVSFLSPYLMIMSGKPTFFFTAVLVDTGTPAGLASQFHIGMLYLHMLVLYGEKERLPNSSSLSTVVASCRCL